MARLTTHVLDTANGRPAAGVAIRLYACDGESRRLVQTVATNADGRVAEAIGVGTGVYELEFSVGAYFGDRGPKPPFLGEVVVRFGISEPDGHYHVPLLVSPYGYSTYRGS